MTLFLNRCREYNEYLCNLIPNNEILNRVVNEHSEEIIINSINKKYNCYLLSYILSFHPNLKKLTLSFNNLSLMDNLCFLLNNRNLEYLNLSHNNFSKNEAFLKKLKMNDTIKKLDLSYSKLGINDRNLKNHKKYQSNTDLLCEILERNKTLEKLYLEGNQFSQFDLTKIKIADQRDICFF